MIKTFSNLLCVILILSFNVQAEKFGYPVDNPNVSQSYNNSTSDGYHTGVDYSSSSGLNIKASASGEIAYLITLDGDDHGMGNCVIIKHNLASGGSAYSLYAHLNSITTGLTVGSIVNKGQSIGVMGGSGYTSSTYWPVHLHFEIKDSPVLHNPSGGGQFWGYTENSADNYGYHSPGDYIDKVDVIPYVDVSISQNLFVYATRKNPANIYALPNEYGSDMPFESEKNFAVNYKIKNNGASSINVEDLGAKITKDGNLLFNLTRGSGGTISPNGELPFDVRGYLTEDHLGGNPNIQLKAEAQYKINGSWVPVTGSGSFATFTVYQRPDLTNGILIKKPRPQGSTNPDLAKIYYYQNGKKWEGTEEGFNNLFAEWNSIYYVYPGATINSLGTPEVPNHNPTIPSVCGRNLLYKKNNQPMTFIIEPEPTGGSLRSREFLNEEAFYSYGYTSSTLANEVISFDQSQYSWIQSQYPVGSVISGTNIKVSNTSDLIGNVSITTGPKYSFSAQPLIIPKKFSGMKKTVLVFDLRGRLIYETTFFNESINLNKNIGNMNIIYIVKGTTIP